LGGCQWWWRQIIGFLALHPTDGFPDGFALIVESSRLDEAGDVMLLVFGQGVTHAEMLSNYWRK
jgi:hypothetical protein